jgi:hypothetical protein
VSTLTQLCVGYLLLVLLLWSGFALLSVAVRHYLNEFWTREDGWANTPRPAPATGLFSAKPHNLVANMEDLE